MGSAKKSQSKTKKAAKTLAKGTTAVGLSVLEKGIEEEIKKRTKTKVEKHSIRFTKQLMKIKYIKSNYKYRTVKKKMTKVITYTVSKFGATVAMKTITMAVGVATVADVIL